MKAIFWFLIFYPRKLMQKFQLLCWYPGLLISWIVNYLLFNFRTSRGPRKKYVTPKIPIFDLLPHVTHQKVSNLEVVRNVYVSVQCDLLWPEGCKKQTKYQYCNEFHTPTHKHTCIKSVAYIKVILRVFKLENQLHKWIRFIK